MKTPFAALIVLLACAAWTAPHAPRALRMTRRSSSASRPSPAGSSLFPCDRCDCWTARSSTPWNWTTSTSCRLDVDRLLHAFRVNAGLPSTAEAAGRLGGAEVRAARPFRRPLPLRLRPDVRQHGR